MNTSNNPAAPENNLHHTVPYRSYDEWASQFDPDSATGEPNIFDDAYLEAVNKHIAEHMGEPFDFDKWNERVNAEPVNLRTRVAESATAGRR